MSRNLAQNVIVDSCDESIRQLLMMGNIFQSKQKNQLANIILQIEIGNKKLYKQFINVVLGILRQNTTSKSVKQLMFDHITQLAITANPVLIKDLNNDAFKVIPTLNLQEEGLKDYVSLWKHMYNGKLEKEEFPNVSKTLQKISTPLSMKLSGKLSKYLSEFNNNLQKAKEKKVEFFQDFDDSSVSESMADQSRIAQIVYMDIMELKAIRQRVESQPLSEENCTEYLIKMKTFLNLKSTFLSGDLLTEFNKQKIWAKHFVDHHQKYIFGYQNINQQSVNKTKQILISLRKDEESIDNPPSNFQKNKNKASLQQEKNFEYFGQGSNQMKAESELRNFTINEVPIDESRMTERSSKDKFPIFNNTLEEKLEVGEINKKLHYQNQTNFVSILGQKDRFYQRMQLQPRQKRVNTVKPIHISQPIAQDTLPLQESILNNISIPLEEGTPKLKINMNQLQQFPKKSNYGENLENSNSRNNCSSSHNPFANSKANYNPQSANKTPYEFYKQNKLNMDVHSPIRSRMAQDDLDSDNLEQNIVIKHHYQKNLAYSNAYNQDNQNTVTQYAQTQVNFNPNPQKLNFNINLNLHSHKKMYSQQISPRSQVFSDSKGNKKRLSELTSQKKQRKVNVLKQQSLNVPQEYAFRPYSVHFKRNEESFNNFKRNCLEQRFSVYASEQLVITCTLKKLQDSKLQVQILYDNQCREQLQMKVLYKIPKSFKIEKVSKIHRNFSLRTIESHIFNLKVSQFPLQMCFLDLSYSSTSESETASNLHIPLPITIKNFIESLASSREEWMKTYKKLNAETQSEPYRIEKTFELNRDVVQPSQLEYVLNREFMNIGASEGYSVQEFGCICHYRDINNLMFLVRISVRVDHIATISVISENETTDNQRDFMKYYLEILVTLLAKYLI